MRKKGGIKKGQRFARDLVKEQAEREKKKIEFAALVIETDNPTEAAHRLYPEKTRKAATDRACTLMKDPFVKEQINKALTKTNVNPDYVLGNIKRIAENSDKESTQLKALELLGKYLKLFSDTDKKTNVNFNVDLTYEQAQRILKRSGSDQGDVVIVEPGPRQLRDNDDE